MRNKLIKLVSIFALTFPLAVNAAPVGMAVIDFNESAATRFALDNLGFDGGVLLFDEVPFQPVDGLSVSGVSFGFTVGGFASTDANYNSGGPGFTTLTTPPQMEGDAAGLLTITFAAPTSFFAFDLVLSSGLTGLGADVSLFDAAGGSLGMFQLGVTPMGSDFAEGHFEYIARVPEPGPLAMLSLGLVAMGVTSRRRRKQQA